MKKIIYLLGILTLFSTTNYSQDISLKGKELFGGMQARHIGPALMSGRIIDVENHPTNPRIIYLGAAGGGVWKSSDTGTTFSPIFDDYAQSIGVVKLDPKHPDEIIWVGTGEIWTRNSVSVGDGLFKSTDGGINWIKVGFENSERISSIVINPDNTDEMYVGVLGPLWSDSEDRGVYKSLDGGKTWDKILYVGPSTGAADVIMDPNNSSVLYTSMWEFRRSGWGFTSGGKTSALYKSIDSGKTWNKIHTGFPEGDLGRIAVAIAPSDTNILYAVLETGEKATNGLWKSSDAGNSWEHLNNDFGLTVRPFYFSRITIDPKNPDVVIKGGLNGSISRDGGNTFKSLGNMHSDIHDVVFDINNSDVLYSGTDGGIYRSWDGGTTFEIVENLPLSQFYHISVDNETPYNVYGGLQDNGSWYGPSSSPGGVNARDWNSVGYGDGFRVLKHPTKNIIYSEMQGAANVWRYDTDKKRTRTVQPMKRKGDPDLRFNWNAPMAISAHAPDRFYMGSQFLHKSEDMGESWDIISPDLTTNDPTKQDQSSSGGLSVDNSGAENHTTIFTIAESPLDENILWIGTDDGNIQVTKDGGENWINVTTNLVGIPANTWVYHIEASVHGKGTAYAVFEGHTTGDMKAYSLKTIDYGQTWTNIITDDVHGFVRNIQEDYESENLLFLGTEFGLYVTIDGGENWSKFENNMPATAVHFMELQKQTNDLVMGTHGRGVIIIDDISPLRELGQEVLAQDVYFFKTKPLIMTEDSGFSGSFGAETQFVGQSKSSAARIVYYLKKRHTFGKMKMEVYDMEGNKITDLNPEKSKGINVVTWGFNKKVPKMAQGKTLSFAGFTSPRVPAGSYKVILTKGKKTYEHVIEVNYDKNSITTLAERKEQEALTETLFNMVEDLAYLVYEINITMGKAKEVIKNDSKGKKKAQQAYNALNHLLKELVVTTGDSYVASAAPELREKMGNLYSNIASTHDRVSGANRDNFELISEEFDTAKSRYKEIQNKEVKKFNSYLVKSGKELTKLKSKKDFLEK
tara:strand:+ start:445 stop:3525 length:3081 start_codon:yes stop_codon:yes gene_type:complete